MFHIVVHISKRLIYACLDERRCSDLWYFPYCMQQSANHMDSETEQNFAERMILVRY